MIEKLSNVPEFSEEILRKILHYTDKEANPVYDAFKSDAFYEIHSGAKGVSKSFGAAVITIFRLVNDKRFNSIWCRNRYKHIQSTLTPTFLKVLDLLASKYGLDFTPFLKFYERGIYWIYDDGGKGRGIHFANWENVQSFQGLTLPATSMYFGELVIDEPQEDPGDSLNVSELMEIYETQRDKLNLILQNTILRLAPPDDFKICVKFLYNIFTTDHFLIQDYHRYAIEFVDDFGNVREDLANELIARGFIQNEVPDFFDGMGLIVTMYAKTFTPAAEISKHQRAIFEELKKKNRRLWMITYAGLTFEDEENRPIKFLQSYIFDKNLNLKPNIKVYTTEEIKNRIRRSELVAVSYGYDVGKLDKSSLVMLLLFNDGVISIFKIFEDIKELPGSGLNIYQSMNRKIFEIVNVLDNEILEELRHQTKRNPDGLNFLDYFSTLDTDNDIIYMYLAELFEKNGSACVVRKALRRKTKNGDFSILSRQEMQKNLFTHGKISIIEDDPAGREFLKKLAMQTIDKNEKKRNEKIHPEIYDVINAFEYALNRIYKMIEFKEVANGG